MENFRKFFIYFGENKKSFYKYFSFSLIAGMLELCGVALTYPFVMKLLSGSNYHGISPLILGILIVFIFLIKNTIMIFYTRFQANFTKKIESEVNLRFMEYFLSAKYQETSQIPLAEKGNILSFLIPNVINNYILRIQNLGVNLFVFVLITLLLFIKFTLATIVTLVFAVVLITIQNRIFKPRLQKISQVMTEAAIQHSQASNEALINIKGVKVSNNEHFFFKNYKSAINNLYKTQKDMMFLNTVPPYITEPVIIILLFILLGIISCQTFSDPNKLVASFAIIVSAIFRLAPAISRIQVNLNGISSAMPMVTELISFAEKFDINSVNPVKEKSFGEFKDKIELKDVSFEYKKDKPVLKNINLVINKGEFIGIAGLSGEGKTTLIDIISGLLTPNSGKYNVDGLPCSSPLKIGYIPQEFNTINASIRENVAFSSEKIDDDKVIKSLKYAQLYDFIEENYKEGIYANPFIDSTGLSLGQKQRLAIARALYSNPDILILDEATSSLDLKTEDEICSVLKSLKGKKTIITVAHRLSTIKSADRIAFMQNKTIEDTLPFEELINKNLKFKELVELASLQD